MSLRRRIIRLVATLGVVACFWACNAPFIPVPPPSQVSFTSELLTNGSGQSSTFWTAHGAPSSPAALARFYIVDIDRQTGVITRAVADGSFLSPPFEGTEGDRISIYYMTPDGDMSPEACLLLRADPGQAPACQ